MTEHAVGDPVTVRESGFTTSVACVEVGEEGAVVYYLDGMGKTPMFSSDLRAPKTNEVVTASLIPDTLPADRTGGSTPSQYRLTVQTRTGPVQVECGDIIDALDLNFNAGEAFKAIWRLEDKDGPIYNLNKVLWFAGRELLRRGHITQEDFWLDKE